jgi:UDP-N-acetylglucosamine acyltransferase
LQAIKIMNTAIHRTAVVEDGAQLGVGVTVGPFAFVAARAVLGDGCVLGPHASVLDYVTLGKECRVHACAVVGDLPQDLGFGGGASYVRVGDRCVLREGVTIHRGTKPETTTEIGDDCFLMANSHCAHNVKLGRRVILANGVLLAGYVQVGDGAIVSGNTGVHQFVRIGRLAMVGGSTAITQDVLPFVMIASGSYNAVAGPNVVGLRRAGISAETRREIRQALLSLCRSGLSTTAAVAEIRATMKSAEAEELCEFATTSKRGYCRSEGRISGESASESES